MNRKRIQAMSFWLMAANFPLLYLAAVNIGSSGMIITSLVVLGMAVLVSALVY